MTILVVGEAFGAAEAEVGQPFVGPSGHMLNSFLRIAGINRDECVITNVFNFRPPGNDIETLMTKDAALAVPGWPTYAPKTWVHRDHAMSLAELESVRRDVNPTLCLALGDTALWALTHQRGIARYRGTPLMTHDGAHKVLPTYHPSAVLRKFTLKPVVMMDIVKAERESLTRELRRPRRFIHLNPSLDDIAEFYETHVIPAPFIAVDTETKAGQITEVGLATSADRALVIPFWSRAARDGNYWPSQREELAAWKWVRRILAEKPTVGQNFQYDMTYLYQTVRITCPQFIGDTMLMQHAMEPELEKGLGFLGSIYTDEPAWKFMRQGVETLKRRIKMREALLRINQKLQLRDKEYGDDYGEDVFDPWEAVFPMLYGTYDSAFGDCAIALLENLLVNNWDNEDLATDIMRELLCGQDLCEYGSSPRVCFPTSEFRTMLPELIRRWRWHESVFWRQAIGVS
ncbi:MAG: hypothetical protein HC888_01590 [Candidatus Competibacteraceae bacterium]|nr:hypothetical protein [Candidatus Competibacteraceae bacterium]